MITEYTNKDLADILTVINDAASKYKGVIPDDCWHEPYMAEQELIDEFDSGVRMFGYSRDDVLAGVMGVQELGGVTLIRHAYTAPVYQGTGIGRLLLQHLFKVSKNPRLLVGTWQDASWAIRFYLRNGFVLHGRETTDQLLKTYWQVPLRQMQNSVVLER